MKIKLLLLSAVIALATTTVASADSNHRYKDQRNQTFDHVEHRDHRTVDRHNRLFSFNLIVPGPSYYMPHRYYNHHDYRNEYRYRNDYKHHNKKHHNRSSKHRDRNNHQGFRDTR
ncbi:MAG: hypothetical protein ACI9FO_000930 [Methylophagaceae bacterium]|jgi:hypothetical protein